MHAGHEGLALVGQNEVVDLAAAASTELAVEAGGANALEVNHPALVAQAVRHLFGPHVGDGVLRQTQAHVDVVERPGGLVGEEVQGDPLSGDAHVRVVRAGPSTSS